MACQAWLCISGLGWGEPPVDIQGRSVRDTCHTDTVGTGHIGGGKSKGEQLIIRRGKTCIHECTAVRTSCSKPKEYMIKTTCQS